MARKLIKEYCDGDVYELENGKFVFDDVDGESKEQYYSAQEAEDEYYIKQAWDHYGSAIRDNNRSQRIQIGKDVDNGNTDD